nr:ISAs1 family transposase [Pleurocapsa sp. PCC 7327]
MSFEKSLIDYLQQIPDPRHPNGRRHPLWLVLLLIIMGLMSGYYGYRGLGTFVERHRRVLRQMFLIRGATVPSYSTIRRVLMEIDYQALCDVFNAWASQIDKEVSRQWVALDGKSLRNTVSDSARAEQNFVSMVSAFSHNRGLVLGVQVMENKHESEIVVVENLLSLLDLQNVVFTVDALHCQKKQSPPLLTVAMTT